MSGSGPRAGGVALAVTLAVVAAPVARAQDAGDSAAAEPLGLAAARAVRDFGSRSPVSLSADGRYLAYPVCAPNRRVPDDGPPDRRDMDKVPAWVTGCRLMMSEVTSGETTEVTEGLGDGWNARWAPTGDRLAFLSTAGGKPALYVKARGRPARLVGRVHPWFMPWWIGSGKVLYLVPRRFHERVATPAAGGPLLLRSSVPGATVTVYRSQANLLPAERERLRDTISTGDDGTADDWSVDLVLYDLASRERTVLEEAARFPYAPPSVVAVSPDGGYIAYEVYRGTAESDGLRHALVTIVLRSTGRPAERRVIADNVRSEPGAQALTWSPDGRYLAWFTNGLTDTGELYVYDSQHGEVRRVVAARRPTTPSEAPVPHFNAGRRTLVGSSGEPAPVWLDSRTVVAKVYSGPAATRPEQKWPTEIWSIDVVSGRTRKVAAIPHGTVWAILTRHGSAQAWIHDTDLMIWVQTGDHDDVLGAVDIRSGRYRAITGGRYSFFFFSTMPMPTATPDGMSALLVRQSASEPPDAWLQPVDGGVPRQLTHLNPGASFRGFGRTELLTYEGPDGKTLQAALKLPPGYTPGHPVPLVVNTYVASQWSFLANHFAFEGGVDNPLLLTSRGYAVLLPDVPIEAGKTGGQAIAGAVLAGVDEAIRRGYADPRRLGITGHSYGGYAVYSAIVRTQRFRAAVVRSGFPDWIPVYLTMRPDGSSSWGIGNAEGSRGPGGTLWERRDQFIENSPLFVFDRITTPVLIVHGTRDYLSDANAKMAFVALRRLGKDAALALYDGEGHSQSEYAVPNQQDYIQREIAWLDRYLCPDRVSPTSCTR